MKDDLDQFENRSDDWLAKQRRHEDSVSAWDFDEGKKLKMEHEIRHAEYNLRNNVKRSQVEDEENREPQNNYSYLNTQRRRQRKKGNVGSLVAVIFTLVYLFIMMCMILFD